MLKLLGAVFILFAATMFGFAQASQYARRPRQIRQLIQALQRLETEMVYGYTPLSEALGRIAGQMPDPLAALFRDAASRMERAGSSARQSWQDAVRAHWPSTAMRGNEQQILCQLGFTLGITDREDQVKHLRMAASLLQAEETTAWDEQKRYEKMWRSLGVLAGAFIVILMY
jgi:stage III sporulation protein AB